MMGDPPRLSAAAAGPRIEGRKTVSGPCRLVFLDPSGRRAVGALGFRRAGRGLDLRTIAATRMRPAFLDDVQEEIFQRGSRMADGFEPATVAAQHLFQIAAQLVAQI